MHIRAVGVEDSRHLDAQVMLPPVVKEERLGAALSFIIARPEANRIDMPPIGFGLWMNLRIAINLAG